MMILNLFKHLDIKINLPSFLKKSIGSTGLVVLCGCSFLIDLDECPSRFESCSSFEMLDSSLMQDVETQDQRVSIEPSIDQDISEPLDQTIENPTDQSLDQYVDQKLDLEIDQTLDQNIQPGWINIDTAPTSILESEIEWKFISPTQRTFLNPNNETQSIDVTLPAFQVSKSEITVWQYSRCVADEICSPPQNMDIACNWWNLDKGDHPMNCISLCQARTFANWVEGRLLSESEWVHLAYNVDQNPYPWGELEPNCQRAHYQGCMPETTQAVCSLSEGYSLQVGLCDLLGNVDEWLAERYQVEWPFFRENATPLYPVDACTDEIMSVTRGGSWNTTADLLSPLIRRGFPSTTQSTMIGFRVAK